MMPRAERYRCGRRADAGCAAGILVAKGASEGAQDARLRIAVGDTIEFLIEADVFLVAAAEVGLFATKKELSRCYPNLLPYTRITLNHFEKQPYQIRQACHTDIPRLLELEMKGWSESLRITEKDIHNRLERFPEGQFVIEEGQHIIGVIYTQRIISTENLKEITYQKISTLHTSQGSLLQLLSINVDPARQGEGFGERLRAFVLQWCIFKGDIEKIVGVTRCQNYKNNSHMPLEEYIQKHVKSPNGVDPILRFHTSHGAKIIGILPRYRPEDIDNQGAGILIEYTIKNHKIKQQDDLLSLEHIEGQKEILKDKKQIVDKVCVLIKELLPKKYQGQFSPEIPLREMGFDSLALLELRILLEQRCHATLDATFFFTYPTPLAIAQYFQKLSIPRAFVNEIQTESFGEEKFHPTEEAIAIVGIGCRFPGNINSIEDYWNMLEKGIEIITEVPATRWQKENYPDFPIHKGGFLSNVDCFDASFFNISPREAEYMDPQQRLLLEIAWQALEHAGINPHTLRASQTGIYLGIFSTDYEKLLNRNSSADDLDIYYSTGNSPSVAAGRLSYFLGLQGPAIVVNTACSSSLVAIHLACQSLRNGDSTLALAGGINLILSPELSIAYAKAGMLSSEGHCKTFDASANGYVRSEGCGIVVLKKLSAAITDQDNILAVIRGSAVNQDGASNGLTAPNRAAQEALLRKALADGKLLPHTVSYIETHGTGTSLGDPVEVKAITEVYGHERDQKNPLILGSVKTNLGHTEAAAGIAGLIKVVLALQNRKIPAHLHFSQLNPHIQLDKTSVLIPTTITNWFSQDNTPLRAGVNSFGFSGTNAHVVIEEGPAPIFSHQQHKPYYLITLSAKHEAILKQKIKDLIKYLEIKPIQTIEAIAYTSNTGRSHFDYRIALVVSSSEELKDTLENEKYFQGDSNKKPDDIAIDEQALRLTLEKLKENNHKGNEVYKKQLEALANLYVKGYDLDWQLLHQGETHQKLSLPTYPFLKKRYWYNDQRHNKLSLSKEAASSPVTTNLNTLRLKEINDTLVQEIIPKTNVAMSSYSPPSKPVQVDKSNFCSSAQIMEELSTLLKQLLYLEDSVSLNPDKTFAEYGLDSILGVELIKQINAKFDLNINAAKLYDFPTVATLAAYIAERVTEQPFSATLQASSCPISSQEMMMDVKAFNQTMALTLKDVSTIKKDQTQEIQENQKIEEDAIAIIGMSARFPGAENITEYWENLKNGTCSIREIPKTRWSIEDYYSEDIEMPGKSYSKWGGFIENVDQFDPLFFNISPAEAEWMDPQQRLFLEEAWKALEDAGFSSSVLNGKKCGVFVGVMNNDYAELIQKTDGTKTAQLMTGNSHSILSSRIAYMLNLKGPVITVDTACSSSLVAVHMACQTLLNQEADLMIVGGVTLYLTETPYIQMSKAGMLSKEGLCKTFDNSADGFVPGEGCGVVILKRLQDAIKDNDRIYGIIRGSGLNQDGKTNGITAPSGESQKALEVSVYETCQINPEDISFIEAHGTGTKLGDPIEVGALIDSFKTFTDKKQYCAIGSVKSNIGHTSAAAGVASLIKVLLCMQHRKLVPTLHYNQPNEHIDFTHSPFYVNTKFKEWEKVNQKPRLAGISSFGFSGTNAHAVIEEWPEPIFSHQQPKPYYLITLSAKHEEVLRQKIKDLINYLKTDSNQTIEPISYTLNIGRSHFNYRLALVVSNSQELKEALESEKYFQGDANKKPDDTAIYEQVLLSTLEKLKENNQKNNSVYKKQLEALANLYVKGYDLDWQLLHQGEVHKKLSLPTYPFLKRHYWITTQNNHFSVLDKNILVAHPLHPMIDINASTFTEQLFKKHLNSAAFYLRDHIVRGQILLPGTGYLEIARAAGYLASRSNVTGIKNVIWLRPVILEEKESLAISISLKPYSDKENFQSYFEIYSEHDNQRSVYCEGELSFNPVLFKDTVLDVEAIRERCHQVIEQTQIYRRLNAFGFDYRDSFRTSQQFWIGEREILQALDLPESIKDSAKEFVLHPALMDGALRTLMGAYLASERFAPLSIPFSMDELKIRKPVNGKCYAYVKRVEHSDEMAGLQKGNVMICNEAGEICVEIKGFTAREFKENSVNRPEAEGQPLFYQPVWKEETLKSLVPVADMKDNVIWINKLLNDSAIERHFLERVPRAEKNSAIRIIYQCLSKKPFDEVVLRLQSLFKAMDKLGIEYCHFIFGYADSQLEGISGLFHAMKMIKPHWTLTTVKLEENDLHSDQKLLDEIISEEKITGQEISYQNSKRFIRIFESLPGMNLENKESLFRKQGVYLLTGGLGGIGKQVARLLAEEYQAKLILLGRRSLNDALKTEIKKLESYGSEVLYVSGDVSDQLTVETVIQQAKEKYGSLNGILHVAGNISSVNFLEASQKEITEVLAPKVKGTLNLDRATQDEALDFFVVFSSISSELGDFGAGSYSLGNRFMDSYMLYREELRQQHQRHGKSLSINWPYWERGGMQLPEEGKAVYMSYMELTPLSTEQGLKIFAKLLTCSFPQVFVAIGNGVKIKGLLNLAHKKDVGIDSIHHIREKVETVGMEERGKDLSELIIQTQAYLKQIFFEVAKVPVEEIAIEKPLEAYGIDSIMILNLNQRLSQDFQNLRKTLLFEYRTLEALGYYLVKEQLQDLKKLLKKELENQYAIKEIISTKSAIKPEPTRSRFDKIKAHSYNNVETQDIAIIGLAGYYSSADNLEEFWEQLTRGLDFIEEIPKERWDYHEYYDPTPRTPGKMHSKWGSFIQDIDKFDALFFNIAPREAEQTDPQERLILEIAWKAIEDAGYNPLALENLSQGKVGVFIGSMWNEYQLLLAQSQEKLLFGSSNMASLANRISYVLNLHGPSLVIDTACSSSLVAIHMAVESLQHGESHYAIAGGVNLSLHPSKYVNMSQMGLLSTDGRCRSFGEGGNGYVPGEGVGAVLLKPLSKALEEGDCIYGVIKGSSMNHGGKTNGFTVPNPDAQAELIKAALSKSNILPENISYIETHGTGTALGDPIEITGLSKAFGEVKKQSCAIGSIKSNIGHLEGAAGIVALTKVLLQLKHRQLVPSIHSETLNPHIDFTNSPFYVQRELSEWELKTNNKRCAGISSFGATGTNAHIIIEEAPEQIFSHQQYKPYYLITLSAKHEEVLRQKIKDLVGYLEKNPNQNIESIAYTTNTGRSHFNYRIALVVSNTGELKESLEGQKYFQGEADKKSDDAAIYKRVLKTTLGELKLNQFENTDDYKEKLEALANLYVKGYDLDWQLLHQGEAHQKLSLPTYPFLKNRYWFPQEKSLTSSEIFPHQLAQAIVAPKTSINYFVPVREEQSITIQTQLLEGEGPILILDKNKYLYKRLQKDLPNTLLLFVQLENSYKLINQYHYKLDLYNLKDYLFLFNELEKKNLLPRHIIYRTNSSHSFELTETHIDRQLKQTYLPLFHLSKTLSSKKYPQEISVTLINENLKEESTLFAEALSGYIKTLYLEYPFVAYRTIHLNDIRKLETKDLLQELNANELEIFYDDHQRWVKRYQEMAQSSLSPTLLKKQGVYLITGGAGGLGLVFAHYFAKYYQANLILVGRSALKESQKLVFSKLEALGAKVKYLQADVSKRDEVEHVLNTIKKEYHHLNGIIHAAGVVSGTAQLNTHKDWDTILNTIKPKIYGTTYLDVLSQSENLDFFVLFSSMSSVLGDIGLSDYAYGNAFLDYFAKEREKLRTQKKRSGKTISINWTLWQEGNKVTEQNQKRLSELYGLIALDNESGWRAFLQAIEQDYSQIMILVGDKEKIISQVSKTHLIFDAKHPKTSQNKTFFSSFEGISNEILNIVGEVLKIAPKDISSQKLLIEYGMDSIQMSTFISKLNSHYGTSHQPTITFMYDTVEKLARYMIEESRQANVAIPQHIIGITKEKNIPSPSKPSLRLFCFPYAGGNPSVFSDWSSSSLLSPNIEVCPLDFHTYGMDPVNTKTVGDIVNRLIDTLPFDMPFAFLGSCLGSLVAYELAKKLQQEGRPLPKHFFVIACAAPHLYPTAMQDTIEIIDNYRQAMGLLPFGREIDPEEYYKKQSQEIQQQGPEIFLDTLEKIGFNVDKLRTHPMLIDAFLPRMLSEVSVAKNYMPSDSKPVPLPFPISAFNGINDDTIKPGFMKAWNAYTNKKFNYYDLSGDHYIVHNHKEVILKVVNQMLIPTASMESAFL